MHLGRYTTRSQDNTVSLKPCIALIAILAILSLKVIFWLGQDGINRTHYWTTQVDGFIQMNQYLSSYPMLWLNLTQLGDAFILLPLVSFFIVTSPRIWAALFGAIPLTSILVHGGKALGAVPRPAAVIDQDLIHVAGEHLTGSDSLPSGHSATVFVAGTIIMLFILSSDRNKTRLWAMLLVLSITIILALSRVAVGAHWPLDTLFGAICGFFGGLSGILLVQRYNKWWGWLRHPEFLFIPGLILLFWSISLLPLLHSEPTEASFVRYLAALIGIGVSYQMLVRRFLHTSLNFKNASLSFQFKYPSIAIAWSKKDIL